MTTRNRMKSQTLNFDEDDWACERALSEIFLRDLEQRGPGSFCEKIVKYLLNEADASSIYGHTHLHLKMARVLRSYLESVFPEKALARGKKHPPIVWCRVATQFWLQFGGRQAEFMSQMTNWLQKKYRGNYPVVEPLRRADSVRYQVPVDVFLFADELRCPLSSGWQLVSIVARGQRGILRKKDSGRSKEDEVGRSLFAAVKTAVEDLRTDMRTRKHFVTGLDVKTGKARFRGRRDDLYDLISRHYDEVGVVPGRGKDESKKRYAKSTVIRAISELAICRRSWVAKGD